MKKKTLWEKRVKKMEQVKQRNIKLIEDLEKEGYVFNKTYKNLIENTKISKRPTQSQYENFISNMKTSEIKKMGKKYIEFEEPGARVKKIYLGTAAQREETYVKNMAKELLKDAKTGIKHGKFKRTQAEIMSRLIRLMEKKTGVQLTHGQRMSEIRSNLYETLAEINPEKFAKAASIWDKMQPRGYGFELEAESMYDLGITKEGMEGKHREIIEKAKATFQSKRGSWDSDGNFHAKYDDKTLERLYDFFNTDTWRKYRESKIGKYDAEQVENLADEIQNNKEVDLDMMLNLLESTQDMDKAMRQYKNIKGL